MTVPLPLPPVEFDVCGALPQGVTVLEASAGTGKTYTIASLTARYVAEGYRLDRLLLVTFTRIATGELRERVRERLVEVERGLTRRLAGADADPAEDPVVALLARHEARERRERLARAIASFDSATIATTHGFCQEMLGGLGIAGDLEPDVTFVEDLSDLVDDVVDDLYLRRFSRGDPALFGRAEAAMIVRAAVQSPFSPIVGGDGELAATRERLARAARCEFEERKRRMRVMTYDDLVIRLRSALSGPAGEAAAIQLRDRFDVVLVDEFQDTDPAQWEIMRLAFGADPAGPVTLVLIADPKQAIYAFRGADVYAYLDAARAAGTRATLPINRRSDQGLIDAHDALFSGVRLGHEEIAYRQVRASADHQAPRLTGAPEPAPLRFRVATRDGLPQTPKGYARAAEARTHVIGDVAADVVRLLNSGARIRRDGGDPDGEPVAPADLAVLVRANWQAAEIRHALQEAGVPAVINGAGSVFGTDEAQEWLRLLEALERPASITRAHAAALTRFIGWPAERLAQADEDSAEWEEVHGRLHDWARVLRTRGIASLLEVVTRETIEAGSPALAARVLRESSGERRLTNLRHVAQLLHSAAAEEQLGPTALTAWLRTRIAEAASDTADEERSRRLESDAEAVQVLTIHRSKGLEFPIVYLPFLWEGWRPRDGEPILFHDPGAGDVQARVDVSLTGSGYRRHFDQYVSEQRGEELRLLYVALTRARHQAIVWWAGSYESRNSPLGRLLFARDDAGNVAPEQSSVPSDAAVVARLRALAAEVPGRIAVEPSAPGAPERWRRDATAASGLGVAAFHRTLDLGWRRTSYSDITAASHEDWVTSEPEQPLLADEPPGATAAPAPEPPPDDAATQTPSPLGGMPSGVDVGTFVHRVMEATDFAAPDLDAELAQRIADVQGRRAVDVGSAAALGAGLRAVIETPLGPILSGRRLRDVARGDRLDELGFELPLAGGDRPSGWLTLSRVASVLRAHVGVEDPLAAYAERLEDARLRQSVRGYLTGSLDLVVRVADGGGAAGATDTTGATGAAGLGGFRFAVLDYKTNWLGAPDEPLTAFHYRPEAMAAEMLHHHYALQALLYTVALHRFLRWRLAGYDPSRHLAGVVYLFVRGMTGAEGGRGSLTAGQRTGVFGWPAPDGLVPALSDALDDGDGR